MSELLLLLSNCSVPKALGTGLKKWKNQGFGPLSFFNVVSALSLSRYTLFKVCVRYRTGYGRLAMTAEIMTKSDRLQAWSRTAQRWSDGFAYGHANTGADAFVPCIGS